MKEDVLAGRVPASFRACGIEPALKPAPSPRRFWALCPFHDDHTPSLDVSNDGSDHPGRWRCRACGARGGLVELAERRLNLSREDAVEWARGKGAFEEPQAPPPASVELDLGAGRREFAMPRSVVVPEWRKCDDVLVRGEEFLARWPSPIQKYFAERGHGRPGPWTLPAWQVARWDLGYATTGRLAGRIVIPVRDAGSTLRSYMARSFADEEPRYLTPHPSEGADLGGLFGSLYWETVPGDEVVVTEGAFNGLAVERAAMVATRGAMFGKGSFAAVGGASELRAEHAAQIGKFARVCVLSDGDDAGDHLADKLRGALGRHVELRRVRLEQDADELPAERLARLLWGDRG